MPPPNRRLREILRVLRNCDIRFVVVGGVSAVLQGVPYMTFDLDIVHSRDPENIERLLIALDSLDAHYRMNPEKRLKPGASHLAGAGHQLLLTRLGPLDLLGMIGKGREYPELHSHSVEMDLGDGLTVAVLDLRTLIQVKEETMGDKDAAVLPLLRRTLEEQSRQ